MNAECAGEWWTRIVREPLFKYLLLISIVAFGVRLIHSFKNKTLTDPISLRSWLKNLMILVILPLIGWLLTAPNLRFASWIFFALGILVVGKLLSPLEITRRQRKNLVFVCFVIGLFSSFRSALVTNPQKVALLDWPLVPDRKTRVLKDFEGFRVYSVEGSFQCWGSPPPCTPESSAFEISKKLGRPIIIPKKADAP